MHSGIKIEKGGHEHVTLKNRLKNLYSGVFGVAEFESDIFF